MFTPKFIWKRAPYESRLNRVCESALVLFAEDSANTDTHTTTIVVIVFLFIFFWHGLLWFKGTKRYHEICELCKLIGV